MEHDGPLLKDTTASVKLLGLEALLVPFLQHTSSQRVSMFASHIVQALPPEYAEHPYLFTGYENIIGRYTFNRTERDQEIFVVDVIPKYIERVGIRQIKINPRLTVIYIGREDGLVHYFHHDTYTCGTDGYGYDNTWSHTSMLKPDMLIPKDVEFSRSPSKIGKNGYGMGTNVNVAFLSLPEVNNDAFLISDRMARKFTTKFYSTVEFDIHPDQVPLNLYGDDEEHKFLPDIGEYVREDGILCGFRSPTDSTFVSDMMSLNTPHVLHDDLYYVSPNSQIVDIEFHASPLRNKVRTDKNLFVQVDKYLQPYVKYWQRIWNNYQELKKKEIPLSPEFNTLATRAGAFIMAYGLRPQGMNRKPDIKLCKGREKIEYIHCKIVYKKDRLVAPGFKLSDRYGAKGVVSAIKPLAEMPTDQYGFITDCVKDPESIPNRMNPGQQYEAGINRVSVFVQRQAIELRKTKGDEAAIAHVLGYIERLNPAYKEIAVEPLVSKNPTYFLDTIEQAEEDGKIGIYLMIPPFLKHITPKKMLELRDAYDVKFSPVVFYPRDKNDKPYRSVTKCNVSIGAEYMYLLYKVPHVKAPGVGYINQFKVPIKPSQHAKLMSLIVQTPLRFGEDENRIGTMCAGPEAIARLMGMHANSFEAVKQTIKTLLTVEDPTSLERVDISNERIKETNNIIGVAKHLMSTMGINMDNIDCEVFNEAKFTRDLITRHPGQF